jgi:hypothetical protein
MSPDANSSRKMKFLLFPEKSYPQSSRVNGRPLNMHQANVSAKKPSCNEMMSIGPAACPYWAMASLLTGRRLGVRVVGIGLLASWWPTTQPTVAPSLPCPAMAAPPTMAPVMQPFASTPGGRTIAIADAMTAANIHFMTALQMLETE